MIYTGAFLFDHPGAGQVAGWGAVAGRAARRYESLSGPLTSPDIIWWTNVEDEVLAKLAMPARFLPENTFGGHMASFLEAWGIPLVTLSASETRERGLSRYFVLTKDPEVAAPLAALIAARIPEWAKVPLACGHYIKQVVPAARSSPAPSVTKALRQLVIDESEYFSRTAERSSPSRTMRVFSLSPMRVARNLAGISSGQGDGLALSYPSGGWRSGRKAQYRTLQDLLDAPRPLLAYAHVELPDSAMANLLVLGSGTKSKTREWFAVPELSLLAGIGAKVTVGGRGRGSLVWEAEGHREITTPAPSLFQDGSWSAGAATLALLSAMGRDQRGQITPTQLWLRGIDMTHTLLAAMRLSGSIGKALPHTRPRIFGYYLGGAWLMLDHLTEDDEPVLQGAALQEGFFPRNAPLYPGLADLVPGAALESRWLAATREVGPVIASLVDGMGLVVTPDQARILKDCAQKGPILSAVTAIAAAYVFADGEGDWTTGVARWMGRQDSPAAIASLIQSAQTLASTLPPSARQSLVKTVGALAHEGRPVDLMREAVARLSARSVLKSKHPQGSAA